MGGDVSTHDILHPPIRADVRLQEKGKKMVGYDTNHTLWGLDYVVSRSGELVLCGYAWKHERNPDIKVVIPHELLEKGPAVVRAHAEGEAMRLIEIAKAERLRKQRERHARLYAIQTFVEVECDGVLLKGKVTYNDRPNQGMFDVALVEPASYAAVDTMDYRRYGPDLLDENIELSSSAIQEAREKLAKLYRQQIKEEKYPEAYVLLKKLEKFLRT